MAELRIPVMVQLDRTIAHDVLTRMALWAGS